MPQFLPEDIEQIGEGDRGLGAIPGAHDPAERAALLEVRSGPQHDQAVDQSSEGGGPFHRLGRLVLGLTEAEVLLCVIDGDRQGPAS
jgi:hypothetical protein